MSESGPTVSPTVAGPIVVGVDGSPASEEALRWAAAQARRTGQPLHALAAWKLPVELGPAPDDEVDWAGNAQDALRETIASALDPADAELVQPYVAEGEPREVLLAAAAEADLLVLGRRGRGRVRGLRLGSVSQYVVAQAHCTVVVVHRAHRSAPQG